MLYRAFKRAHSDHQRAANDSTGTERLWASETLRPEYRFDYTKARPNRFAGRGVSKSVVVLLDPDVAKVFKSAESVNSVLRAILAAVPRKRKP